MAMIPPIVPVSYLTTRSDEGQAENELKTNPNKIPPKPVGRRGQSLVSIRIFSRMNVPANADIMIAHSSDDVSMPPPVPPGPPAMFEYAFKWEGWRALGSEKGGTK
jgi:hypothetical protein